MNKTQITEEKKKIDNFKAHFKQGLNKKGNAAFIEVSFNKDLCNMIKTATISEETETDYLRIGENEEGETPTDINKFIRYKVKGVVFSCLGTQKDFIFVKKLLDKGKYTFEFYNFDYLESFKSYLKVNLQKVISLLIGLEVEETITFKARD